MAARRVVGFAEGTLRVGEMTATEAAIQELVGKSVDAPARLAPRDLVPLVGEIGLSGTLEIVAMIGAFHYINRIADMVGVESWVPRPMRGWRWARRAALRLQSRVVAAGMDFSARSVVIDAGAELAAIERLRGEPLPAGYRQMMAAPTLAAYTRTMMAGLAAIDRGLYRRVSREVAAALPAGRQAAAGAGETPAGPLAALVRVATSRPSAVTAELVDAVRRRHRWTDAQLTDLFYLVAVRNDLERFDRWLAEPVA